MFDEELYIVKAKSIDSDEWIEGFLYSYGRTEKYVVYRYEANVNIEAVAYEIDKDTICRFTGLYDKKRNKVWENDIIMYSDKNNSNFKTFNPIYAQIKYGIYRNDMDTASTKHNGFYADWQDSYNRKDLGYWILNCSNIDIVGNIFDNANLIIKEEK